MADPTATTGGRTGTPSPRSLSFTPAFDGIRGIAILLVVSFHLRVLGGPWYRSAAPKGGSLGVDIFFVLSGFLITALLLREQASERGLRLGAFYRRRALRLLPAMFALMAAHVVYATIDHINARFELSSVLSVVFYYANWKIAAGNSFTPIAPGLAHLWSLAVEEQFYLAWPLLLALFLGLRRRTAVAAGIIGFAIAAVVVTRILLLRSTPGVVLYFRTDMRADSLLVGALAARIWITARIPRRYLSPAAWIALAFVILCVFRVPYQNRFLLQGGYTLFAVAVAVILLATLDTAWLPKRFFELRSLRAVGRVSYGLYLWHYFVFHVVAVHTTHWGVVARMSVGLSLATIATLCSWQFVEKPFLRRKDRIAE